MTTKRNAVVRLSAAALAIGGCYWAFWAAGCAVAGLFSMRWDFFLFALLLCAGFWVWYGWILRASNQKPFVRADVFWFVSMAVNAICALLIDFWLARVWCFTAVVTSAVCAVLDMSLSNSRRIERTP